MNSALVAASIAVISTVIAAVLYVRERRRVRLALAAIHGARRGAPCASPPRRRPTIDELCDEVIAAIAPDDHDRAGSQRSPDSGPTGRDARVTQRLRASTAPLSLAHQLAAFTTRTSTGLAAPPRRLARGSEGLRVRAPTSNPDRDSSDDVRTLSETDGGALDREPT